MPPGTTTRCSTSPAFQWWWPRSCSLWYLYGQRSSRSTLPWASCLLTRRTFNSKRNRRQKASKFKLLLPITACILLLWAGVRACYSIIQTCARQELLLPCFVEGKSIKNWKTTEERRVSWPTFVKVFYIAFSGFQSISVVKQNKLSSCLSHLSKIKCRNA